VQARKKSKTPASFEDYLRQVADVSQPLSVAALYRFSDLGEPDLELLETAWPLVPSRRRREIVQHLVDLTETNFELDCDALFWACLNDADAAVRVAAIDGLWVSKDLRQITPLLELMLHDSDARVRATAAGSLARFVLMSELDEIPPPHADLAGKILNALRAVIANTSEDIEVRRRAVEAIAYSGSKGVAQIIREAYNSPEEKMRVSAVCGMGRSADRQWVGTIVREMASRSPEMRYEAARAAGELEARPAVPALAELLQDVDREVQEVAVWALGQIGGKRASQLLYKCYEEGDEGLQEAAGEAIEEMSLMRGMELPLFLFEPDADEDDADLDALVAQDEDEE
jgi:HEAT repeat protein